jgi:hypothetical protein
MAFSRRVFWSLIGLLPLLAVRRGHTADANQALAALGDHLVVVNGWVLHRDDLDQLAPR